MVGMGIEMVPAQVGEAGDIRLGDGPFVGYHGVAYLQFFKIFPEGVFVFRRLAGHGVARYW